jgi:hypothetical protein
MAELIDQARGYLSASQFFRNALYNEMERAGVKVPQRLLYGRDRKGVGGRPRKQEVVEAIVPEQELKTADTPAAVTEERHRVLRYAKADRPKRTNTTERPKA